VRKAKRTNKRARVQSARAERYLNAVRMAERMTVLFAACADADRTGEPCAGLVDEMRDLLCALTVSVPPRCA
jgi:hypothetical protein